MFVHSFVQHHAKNGPIHRKMVVDRPLFITSKEKPYSRPDKTREEERMVQLVFCIVGRVHWVLFSKPLGMFGLVSLMSLVGLMSRVEGGPGAILMPGSVHIVGVMSLVYC